MAWWYQQNIVVYVSEAALAASERLRQAREAGRRDTSTTRPRSRERPSGRAATFVPQRFEDGVRLGPLMFTVNTAVCGRDSGELRQLLRGSKAVWHVHRDELTPRAPCSIASLTSVFI